MELKLPKQIPVYLAAFFSVAVLIAILAIMFSASFQDHSSELNEKNLKLSQYRDLLTHKEALKSLWDSEKLDLSLGRNISEITNQWVKRLIDYAQSQNFSFTKLEPQNLDQTSVEDEVKLYLTFDGDIIKFVRFAYYLLAHEPLTKIESYSIKQDEPKHFSYEVMLKQKIL